MDITKIQNAVEKHKQEILDAERWIWKHPETGYGEWKTDAYMKEAFTALGYTLNAPGDIPGFTAVLDTGKPGPCILVLGELDSLICADHPEADPETKAVHACGHNAQCAGLLGVAAALKEPGVTDGLCGKIMLCAVPAEEAIEIGKRMKMRSEGKIRYLGGKVEFLYRGLFDECDIALMVHTTGGESFSVGRGSNGMLLKTIAYQGKASHAGGSPEDGINALYAATLGMQAVNSLRETFRDSDHIRFHPIMTEGGDVVNAIPAAAVLESYVRGATMDAIVRENDKVNRALACSAAAMGANVRLVDCPGYAPLNNNEDLVGLAGRVLRTFVPEEHIRITDGWGTGCTDMGDLSSVMPSIHPYAPGAIGAGHGKDYYIDNPYTACVQSAVFQTGMVCSLLENGAAEAEKVLANKKCVYGSKEEYFRVMDAIWLDKQAVTYGEDGTVTICTKN